MILELKIIAIMNERLYKIDQLLSERRSVTVDDLLAHLEVSRATLKRDLVYMRDRLNAPVIFDRELGGYRYDKESKGAGTPFALPGLWFSSEEIYALLTMHHLVANLDAGGLLGSQVKPLQSRLTALLGAANDPVDEVRRRIKIAMIRVRNIPVGHFGVIGSALLKRKRILIDHYSRGSDQQTQREVSPQRMIYYHGNWYLDAWCHLRKNLRNFAMDTILRVELLDKEAKELSDQKLDETLSVGYGIFAGKQVQWATLLFTPQLSRWVSGERWHQDQKSRMHEDGSYELSVPYSDDTELVMDILRYGANVKVIGPDSLKAHIVAEVDKLRVVYAT